MSPRNTPGACLLGARADSVADDDDDDVEEEEEEEVSDACVSIEGGDDAMSDGRSAATKDQDLLTKIRDMAGTSVTSLTSNAIEGLRGKFNKTGI